MLLPAANAANVCQPIFLATLVAFVGNCTAQKSLHLPFKLRAHGQWPGDPTMALKTMPPYQKTNSYCSRSLQFLANMQQQCLTTTGMVGLLAESRYDCISMPAAISADKRLRSRTVNVSRLLFATRRNNYDGHSICSTMVPGQPGYGYRTGMKRWFFIPLRLFPLRSSCASPLRLSLARSCAACVSVTFGVLEGFFFASMVPQKYRHEKIDQE